jgi:hypothetical protein
MQMLKLPNRATATFTHWLEQHLAAPEATRAFVAVSGYESRSRHWVECALQNEIKIADSFADYTVFGMTEHADVLARPDNDAFYGSNHLDITPVAADEPNDFRLRIEAMVRTLVHDSNATPCEIHLDYSSMPRSWYCAVPRVLESILRPKDRAYLWYSPGTYPKSEYPTVGTDDFRVFSGRASLAPKFRTHLMGLGFDRIRSEAIWSVVDPENLIAFYANPGSSPEYVWRVIEDNKEILRAAEHELALPLSDMALAIDRLLSTVLEFRRLGDVILVPDGPKPLILAASLIPELVGRIGVVCFHVARRKTKAIQPVDVAAHGQPVGLQFSGTG